MQRLIKLLVVLAVLAGGAYYLSSRVSEQPLTRQEKAVSLDALRK